MELKQRVYDIDDGWQLAHHAGSQDRLFELIDEALIEMSLADTLQITRGKAEIYLRNGAKLVWIVLSETERAEVCRQTEKGRISRNAFGAADTFTGEDALPGFALKARCIFD